MSFASARAENFKAVILGAGHFSELVTLHPVGGPARQIRARVRRKEMHPDQEGMVADVEELEVKVGRDPEDAEIGGVLEPKIGDVLHRSERGDPPDKLYAFSGQVLEETAYSWRLRFERAEPDQAGTIQVMRVS